MRIKPTIEGAILAVKERAARARLTIELAIAPSVDTMLADEARIRQILYNILSNAIGFSRPGGRVSVKCQSRQGMIEIQVADKGMGIAKGEHHTVLERFVSRSQGSKHRGVGLGLPVAKSLVELHGGYLKLESEEGVGTTVTVSIPEAPASKPPGARGAAVARRA